ncbi:MAG: nitrite/sulfite reductase [Burkholderiales bacterium]
MYQYDNYDQTIVNERVAQYRDQTRRFLAGELTEDEFRPLRLQNGLYLQRQAPMLRVAVPYGMLSSKQVRMLAHIARKYDKGYGHLTTRQNIQYNWPKLEDTPDILADLASVEMHAIQTSGNCIRNITTDQFAGAAQDEIVDPRPYCEILRQWSTFHPEFAYLPRKFKVAVSGSVEDRAATAVHDIGLYIKKNAAGEVVLDVLAGGGLGRTPMVGAVIRKELPWQHMMSYCEAILRVYNRYGRRDNLYKARIKILVKALTPAKFAEEVDAEWQHLKDGPATLTQAELARVSAHFSAPDYENVGVINGAYYQYLSENKAFAQWVKRSVRRHRVTGYCSVTLSLKPQGVAPGDITDSQLEYVADWADEYSYGEVRVSHEQNLILSDVKERDLFALWEKAKAVGLATPNIGLLSDIVCCPGGDFCSLANAKSLPIAAAIQERFESLDYQYDIGELDLNISGCMNSCGHHHVGHIGILGVDKSGSEWYQISIGGHSGRALGERATAPATALGAVIGPSFAAADVPDVIETLVQTYVENRFEDEYFVDTVNRIGIEPFKGNVYRNAGHGKEAAHA